MTVKTIDAMLDKISDLNNRIAFMKEELAAKDTEIKELQNLIYIKTNTIKSCFRTIKEMEDSSC